MLTCAIVHYNLRMLRKWAKSNGRTDHVLFEPDPDIVGYQPITQHEALRIPEANAPPLAA